MKEPRKNGQAIEGYLFALASTAIWSGNFAIARGLNQSVSPIALAFFRWAVATLAILPFALKPLVAERALIRKNLPYLALAAVLGITIFNTLIYFAGRSTTAINLSLISITFPIFIVILSRVFYREPITINKMIGIVLVVAGVILLITKGAMASLLSISFAPGDALMLLAALTFAVYSILLRRKPKGMSLWTLQASTFIIGLVFLFPLFVADSLRAAPVRFDAKLILAILYVGVMASLTAFILWNKAIEKIGASKAGMVYYLMPFMSGMLAFFFLGEKIGLIHLYSILLIVPGILVANHEPKKKAGAAVGSPRID